VLSFPPLPPLHGDPADLTGPLWTTWKIDVTVALGVFVLIAGYLLVTGPLNQRRPDAAARTVSAGQRTAFLAGVLTLLVALGPPVEDWSGLLLTGHMLQHILLTALAPPLLLLGTPAWLLEPLTRRPLVNRLGYLLTRPVVALIVPAAVFIFWHVPVLYDAALRSEPIHVLEHNLYIATGLMMWWPLVGPLPAWPRLSLGPQCLYLAAQTISGGVVGSFITVAEPGLYESYVGLPRMWGISLSTDQQIAGLMMWVGINTIYLLIITVIFFRWAAREEAKERSPRPATVNRSP
jgi:putative membrane protein